VSAHRYEDLPRTFELLGDVKLIDGRFAFGVRVLRGQVVVSEDLALVSVDAASVMNAQLTRLLNLRDDPDVEERMRKREEQWRRWGWS
jgi:hypothetical protein